MRKYLVTVIILIGVAACKNNKSSNVDKVNKVETGSDSSQFINAFKELKLPFSVTDTNMTDLAKTDTIGYALFTQFVPDTIFNNPFGKSRKLSIYPIGKIGQKGKETYFATFVKDKNQSVVYLFVYDKKKFTASIPLVISNKDDILNTASIDKKLSVVINKEWTLKNDIFYKRTIYAYNNAGVFTTVLTETNEDRTEKGGVINPLDTFPKKYKYSGDYTKGKKNVLFIRDGKVAGEYLFFVHFEGESKDEPCGGELKGSLHMVSEKEAAYSGSGDPCALSFTFKSNEVKVKENGSCGNYRGIKCFFNDTYIKKKEPKTSVKKK
ncbi:hypothetical protein [Segetibacter koreensis]|uniref:hypothetical protein n=1 Tax=Segetibacter koreensis TaxID=398037 RepID=UPI00036C43CA|nr:hypothetical protein [Segetibacter koreensis]